MTALITDPSMTASWLFDPVDGSGDGELADAVAVALGTDRIADPSDSLPDPNDDNRRDWWGDLDAVLLFNGWAIGSRLWLLAREKITGSAAKQGATAAKIDAYIREAMKPFVDRKIASSMQITVTRVDVDYFTAQVVLYRGPAVLVDIQYSGLWSKIAP